MSKRKINTKDLVDQIEKLTRDRITKESVVSLQDFRSATRKVEPKTILFVDDDETLRTGLKRIFEADGHRVLIAADGTQLSTVIDDSPIDLILLDVGLPWINGFELAQLMKQNEDLKHIPLVFLSGKTSELDVQRGFQAGASDYIKKPFEIEHLRKTISVLLKLNEPSS
jgi:two-component system aerobic respiration control protein ArcA